jgi:hypothetical protein
MRAEAIELLTVGRAVGEEYVAGRAEFQEQVHVRALVFDFLAELGLDVIAWAERSLAEVRTWDDLSPDGKAARGVELIARQIARYLPETAGPPPSSGASAASRTPPPRAARAAAPAR